MLSRTAGIGLVGAVRTAERVVEVLAGGNIALATLRVAWWSVGRSGGVGRDLRLCLRLCRRLSDCRAGCVWCRARQARQISLLHEVLPNLGRQRAAGDALHRAVIVIADPDADDEEVVETDEPGIPVVLCGAGLAGGKAVERRRSTGAMLDHAPQEADELPLVSSK